MSKIFSKKIYIIFIGVFAIALIALGATVGVWAVNAKDNLWYHNSESDAYTYPERCAPNTNHITILPYGFFITILFT